MLYYSHFSWYTWSAWIILLPTSCEPLKAVLQHDTKSDRRVLRRREPHLDAEIELEYRSAMPEDATRWSLFASYCKPAFRPTIAFLWSTRLPHKTIYVCGLLHPLIDPTTYCGAKLSSAWSLTLKQCTHGTHFRHVIILKTVSSYTSNKKSALKVDNS